MVVRKEYLSPVAGMLEQRWCLIIQTIYMLCLGKPLILSRSELDCMRLTDELHAREAVAQANPDVIIHCVALVNVDACENNMNDAYALHVTAAKTFADECRQRGIQIIYISTDSVFNGRKTGIYRDRHARS